MGHQVYISRFPEDVTEEEIKEFCNRAYIPFGIRPNGIRLKGGYGFVDFYDARAADNAVIELNGKTLKGKRVKVAHAYGRGYRKEEDQVRRRRRGNDQDEEQSTNPRKKAKVQKPATTTMELRSRRGRSTAKEEEGESPRPSTSREAQT